MDVRARAEITGTLYETDIPDCLGILLEEYVSQDRGKTMEIISHESEALDCKRRR